MNFDEMTIEELKAYAKSIGVTVGNCGKEKLIEKINKAIANENKTESDESIDEEKEEVKEEVKEETNVNKTKTSSLLDSISSAIDDLEDSEKDDVLDELVDLPLDTVIPVKSITYGGFTHKSSTTGSLFRWKNIGAVEYMTVAELNEMNNYHPEYLQKPYVILVDEKAIKKFRLTKVYENVAKINNLKEVFATQDLDKIASVVDDALMVNMRDILISKVRQMIKNKTLNNINIIRLLEKKLQNDLSDLV